jgi:WD40 repeat protein/HEAT repeat protein
MSIMVSCACGKSYPIKEQFAGMRVECPNCKRVITVPGRSGGPPAPKRAAAVRPAAADEIIDLPLAAPPRGPSCAAARVANTEPIVDLPLADDDRGAPPPPSSSGSLVLILSAVFALLLAGGGVTLYFLLRDDRGTKDDRQASETDSKNDDKKKTDGDKKKPDGKDSDKKDPEKKNPEKKDPEKKDPVDPTPPVVAGPWQGHYARILGVGFARDGRFAITASGGLVTREGTKVPAADTTVRLWDPASGMEVKRLDGFTRGLSAVAFDPSGALVAAAKLADGQADAFDIHLWSLAEKREVRVLKGHDGPVTCAAFTADGRRLLSGGADARLRVWDVEAGTQVGEFGHPGYINDIAVANDGRFVVTACADRAARVFDLVQKKLVKELPRHQDIVWAVAISPDAKLAASAGGGDYDGTQGRFVPGSRDYDIRLWDLATGQEVRRFRGHTDNVRALAFSPDGRRLLSAGYDKTVRLWHVASGRELATFDKHSEWVQCVAFFPDGRRALSGGYDKTLQVWTLPPEPADLVRKLQDPAADKVETMREIGRYGPEAKEAVPILVKLLSDANSSVKQTALETLMKVGTVSREHVEQLIPLLKDAAFPEGRQFAVNALASLGADARPALAEVAALLKDKDAGIRVKAITIIAAVGTEARAVAYTPLLERLRDSDAAVAKAAADALVKLGKPTKAELPTLEAFLSDPQEPVRRYALLAIAGMGEEAAPSLGRILPVLEKDTSADCRLLALAALLKTQSSAKTLANPLAQALTDTEPKVRVAAAEALAALPADLATMLKMMEHTDPAVQKIAEAAVDKFPFGPQHVKTINDGLQSKREAVRLRMLKAAAKLGKDAAGAVPGLIDVVKTSSGETRALAIDVLANLGPDAKAAGPALVPLLKDGDRKSRLAIALVLGKIQAEEAEQAIPFLVGLLRLEDESDMEGVEAQKTARETLVKIGGPAIDELLKALTNAFVGGNLGTVDGQARARGRLAVILTFEQMGAKANKNEVKRALARFEANDPVPIVKAAAKQARESIQKAKP